MPTPGPLSRLRALPEGTRRAIARVSIITIAAIIFGTWLWWPYNDGNTTVDDDWRSLFNDIKGTWNESQDQINQIKNELAEVRDVLTAPQTDEEIKRAEIEFKTQSWEVYQNEAYGFIIKRPANTVTATGAPPLIIRIADDTGKELVQFIAAPTSTTVFASTTKAWQIASSTIIAFDLSHTTTSNLIIETFQALPDHL